MSAPDPTAYDKLADLSRELRYLKDAQAILGWDQEVNLAKKGVAYRAQQLAFLSGEAHQRFTREEVGDWLAEADQSAETLNPQQTANLAHWQREYQRATCLPLALVKKMAETQALAHEAWSQARAASDFSQFRQPLGELIELSKEQVGHWGYSDQPYNGLLDIYERGATVQQLDQVFDELKPDLIPLVEEACGRETYAPTELRGDYPIEKQTALNQEIAESIGFDFDAGRIDTAVHPFCTGLGPMDTRLTTRYDETDFRSSLYGVLHEAGHGMYEQGLDAEQHGLPTGDAVSLGVHESQSRLWENHVGRSLSFWEKWLPRAAHYFPQLSGLSAEQMYRACNQAEKTHIRVEADEVTYDLHIILRYEMEKAIFSGDLALDDIPAAWDEKFEQSFGLQVDTPANGCLQDIHWSMGGFGYFPTYSLGNLNASHLVAAARGSGSVAAAMDSGDYSPLLAWMREHIHQPGSLLAPEQLIETAAGSPVSSAAHLAHLSQRYLGN